MAEDQTTDIAGYIATAERDLSQGDFASAKENFEAALQLDDECVAALHGLGVITAQCRDYEMANTLLQKACTLLPDNPKIHGHLANVLMAMGDFDNAKKHYEKAIALAPNNPDPHNNLGNYYLKQQKFEDAMRCYRNAIQLLPTHHDAHFNLGRLLVHQEQYQDAKVHLIEANKSIEKHIPTLYALAVAFEKTKAIEQAIGCFQEIIALDPSHSQAQQNLAVCLLAEERYDEAKSHLEKLLALTPSDPMISYNLAVICTTEQRYADAINYYKASLKLHPYSVATHTNIANLYLGFGDEALAIQHFHRVLALDPNNQAVLFRLAAITGDETAVVSSADYIKGLFDYYAPRYEQDLKDNLQYKLPDYLSEQLMKLNAGATHRICDLGCGTGLCGQVAKPHARYLVGIDLSEKMLRRAREKYCYDTLIEGDIVTGLAETASSFDVVIAGDVFSYFGDLNPIFQTVQSRLADGGYFMFTTEKADDDIKDYKLCKTTRYVHRKDYVELLASQLGFESIYHETIPLRLQNEVPVMGDFYVFKR